MNKETRVAFIEGRPQAHPTHRKYAKEAGADIYHVDFKYRYHDIPNVPAWKRYLSWVICAIALSRNKYDVYFSEEAYFMVGLMKWLKLLSKRQKIVALMSTHTLYFLKNNRYPASTKKASIALLKSYDAFICVGSFQKQLLEDLVGESHKVPIYTIFNGVTINRLKELKAVNPKLDGYHILFLGDIPNKDRIWYKGIDLMLQAFNEVKKVYSQVQFTIIGSYSQADAEFLLGSVDPSFRSSVIFTGNVSNIEDYMQQSSLYLHCARGEAWGISVTEAMAAGIIPIVSEDTGAKEVVSKVDSRLIVGLQVAEIVQTILWYFQLSKDEKEELSSNCRKIVEQHYTEEKAMEYFKLTFSKMMHQLQFSE